MSINTELANGQHVPSGVPSAVDRLNDLAARINVEHAAAVTGYIAHAIEAGALLIEAKRELKRLEGTGARWLPWLKKHFRFSERTAQLYMVCAENRDRLEDVLKNPQRVADFRLRDVPKLLAPPKNHPTPVDEPESNSADFEHDTYAGADLRQADITMDEPNADADPLALPESLKRGPDLSAEGHKADAAKDAEIKIAAPGAPRQRSQPARRPHHGQTPASSAEPCQNRLSVGASESPDVREAKARALQDVGPNSSGEVERKRARFEELENEKRRLQTIVVGLESENKELRAAGRLSADAFLGAEREEQQRFLDAIGAEKILAAMSTEMCAALRVFFLDQPPNQAPPAAPSADEWPELPASLIRSRAVISAKSERE